MIEAVGKNRNAMTLVANTSESKVKVLCDASDARYQTINDKNKSISVQNRYNFCT